MTPRAVTPHVARSPAGVPGLVRRRRGEAGFTLIELAVATAVLLVAVLLACELLDQSGRLLGHSVRRARDPWTLLAAELLRNDLRGAKPPGDLDPGWHHVPLQLLTDDGRVEWRSVDGQLVREAGGVEHAYIQQVRSFRWRQPSRDSVEVWVRYRTSSPYLRQLAGALPRSDPGRDEDLHVLMVTRGGYAAEQW